MVSSNLPKNPRIFFQDFCPSLSKGLCLNNLQWPTVGTYCRWWPNVGGLVLCTKQPTLACITGCFNSIWHTLDYLINAQPRLLILKILPPPACLLNLYILPSLLFLHLFFTYFSYVIILLCQSRLAQFWQDFVGKALVLVNPTELEIF